jgi:hypothetical protein
VVLPSLIQAMHELDYAGAATSSSSAQQQDPGLGAKLDEEPQPSSTTAALS